MTAVRYEIRVRGVLDRRWSAWFDGLELSSEPGGVTVIAGEVADQAALHGLLAKVRDLGLPLLSVTPHT
ncbi:MAG TPA: hypothetical protein VGR74_08900 [Actinomycetota bacterium]|nr:hypothetical protein [Actinomycetota bacterium]